MKYFNTHNQREYILVLGPAYEKRPFPGLNKWLEALRSGNYEQGKARLWTAGSNSYCCLGVLSKIQGRLTDNGFDGSNCYTLADSNPRYPELRSNGGLPKEVYFKTDLEGTDEHYTSLADLNDSGMSFKEIAELLELVFYHVDETQPTNDGENCGGSSSEKLPVSGEPETGSSNTSDGKDPS